MAFKKSRRDFIVKSTVAGAGFFIVPRHVLGGPGFTAPSDQLAIAAIGSGGKGGSDLKNAFNGGKNRIVALCDVDPERATQAIKDHSKASFYYDYRVMLDKELDIDAVTIGTPDHTHALIAQNAMLRGKHVYVQKPLTHTISEARLLTQTAEKYKIVTQMGNQGGSNQGVIRLKQWVQDQEIGRIEKVQVWTNRPVWPQGIQMPLANENEKPEKLDWDLWLGPATKRPFTPGLHPFNWRGFWEYGTGSLGDMGCHLFDAPYKALQLGYPSGVQCSVVDVYKEMWRPEYTPEACPLAAKVAIDFPADKNNPNGVVFEWMDGGLQPAIPEELAATFVPKTNGVYMMGSNGVITCDTYGNHPTLFKKGQEPLLFDTSVQGNLDLNHNQAWTEACKAGHGSVEHNALTSSFDYAGPFTETVLMGNLAIRSHQLRRENASGREEYFGRKKLYWDGVNMKITNLEEANQFVTKPYRKGWELSNL